MKTLAPSRFTLGARQEKETSNASLSLLHLSLWLQGQTKAKIADVINYSLRESVESKAGPDRFKESEPSSPSHYSPVGRAGRKVVVHCLSKKTQSGLSLFPDQLSVPIEVVAGDSPVRNSERPLSIFSWLACGKSVGWTSHGALNQKYSSLNRWKCAILKLQTLAPSLTHGPLGAGLGGQRLTMLAFSVFWNKDNLCRTTKGSQLINRLSFEPNFRAIHSGVNFSVALFAKRNNVIALVSAAVAKWYYVMAVSRLIYQAAPADAIFPNRQTLMFMPVEGCPPLAHIIEWQSARYRACLAQKIRQTVFRVDAAKSPRKCKGRPLFVHFESEYNTLGGGV